MTRRLFVLPSACAIVLSTIATAGRPAPKEAAFMVTIKSNLLMAVGQELKMDADTEFNYLWQRDGKVRTLLVNSAMVKILVGGMEQMNAKLSRVSLIDRSGGKMNEIKAADGPDQLRRMLTDSFGSPLCKIEVDAAGKELKRTIVAGPGAKELIDGGMIANTTLFHPWYAADKDEWEANMEVSAGVSVASGKATYTKVPGGKGGQAVKVAAILTIDGVKGPGGLTIKNGKYVVSGEQTYDAARGEWIAGKLTLDISFKLNDGDKAIGGATGTMAVTFEMLPDKK